MDQSEDAVIKRVTVDVTVGPDIVDHDQARPGQSSHIYRCEPGDEYGWVTDTSWWDDIDEPVTTVRQRWLLLEETKVTFHPRTELCPQCHGEEQVEYDEATMLPDGADPSEPRNDLPGWDERNPEEGPFMVICPTCRGDGGHPLAGEMEIHDG